MQLLKGSVLQGDATLYWNTLIDGVPGEIRRATGYIKWT